MKLHREILRLAIPSILAGLTVPLVGMVDLAVAGHLGGADTYSAAALIGGISVGTMLFDLLYWSFGFLRTGTGGLTAQAYGRHLVNPSDVDDPELGRILRRGLQTALGAGLLLIVLQRAILLLVFLPVDCSPEVRELATRYFYIRIWAAPATLSLFAFKGWFIGVQDSVRPMVADLLVNGVNILLSVGLGFGYGPLPAMGFSGVALGTVIAQWAGLLYCAIALRRYRLLTRNSLSLSRLLKSPQSKCRRRFQENADTEGLGCQGGKADEPEIRLWTLNRDLFLRSAGMIAVYIGFTMISARYGDMVLAVSAILMKLLLIFSYFTDGFAYAGEALTGRFIGEGSREGVRTTVRETFLWAGGLAVAFMLFYLWAGVPVFRLMTSDASVVDAGRNYLPWLLLMPLTGCAAFTWDGIFIGATAGKDLRNSTLLCAVGFFAVWLAGKVMAGASLTPETALHILMAAYFVHLLIRALYLTLRYRPSILSRTP